MGVLAEGGRGFVIGAVVALTLGLAGYAAWKLFKM